MNSKVTLRRCVSCRQLHDRCELLRVIRLPGGQGLALDSGMGRSAYLCPEDNCLEEATRRKRLQKALRCQVPESVFAVLKQRLNQSIGESAEAD